VTALGLYGRLQAEYPASPEALAAKISVGMLELQRGQASSALAQFRAYRRANARSLRAEALWGEAEALRALGRSDEERAALDSLLSDHPGSAYAPAARKRLGRD
jgi:TolA-binding protein